MSARPNILIVFTDQQRLDTIQALGSNFEAKTPNMDFLVREGITFTNCHCTAPICSPSRSSMVTGLYPSQTGMPGNLYSPCPPLSCTMPTLGNYFRSAGYETLYHGKWHLGGDVKDYGFEVGEEVSYDEAARYEASRVWRDRDWVANERPFIHMVSFLNPHDLYFYDPNGRVDNFKRPWKNANLNRDDLPQCVANKRVDHTEEHWGEYHRYYSEMIERADAELGELLHQFRNSGFYNNSWIIFTADHGDMAGEQDLAFKGSYMFDGVTKVPFIMVPPMTRFAGADRSGQFTHDYKPGKRDQLCSLVDLLPTVMDLAGIDQPDNLPGSSLMPIVKDEEAPAAHDAVFAQWHKPAIRMCRTNTHKYNRYETGEEELYDLVTDPHETQNLAYDESHDSTKQQLSQRLNQHMQDIADPFDNNGGHEFVFNPSPNHQLGTAMSSDGFSGRK